MLDLLGIMLSSIIMVLVILRAVQADSLQPWFRPPKQGDDSSGLQIRPNEVPLKEPLSGDARGRDETPPRWMTDLSNT
jgi:hypothetical protein